MPVPGVVITDFQSVDWWSVEWRALPRDKIHGILRGYRLIYYMSYRSDVPVGGEIKPVVIEFDKFTFYYKVKNLVNYATYNVTVTGYTNAGNGPTPEIFASKVMITFLFLSFFLEYVSHSISYLFMG